MYTLPDFLCERNDFRADYITTHHGTQITKPHAFLNTAFFEEIRRISALMGDDGEDDVNPDMTRFKFCRLWNQLRGEYNFVQTNAPDPGADREQEIEVLDQNPQDIECEWLQTILRLVDEVIRPNASVDY